MEGGFENELARNRKRLVDKFPLNDVEWLPAGTIGTWREVIADSSRRGSKLACKPVWGIVKRRRDWVGPWMI